MSSSLQYTLGYLGYPRKEFPSLHCAARCSRVSDLTTVHFPPRSPVHCVYVRCAAKHLAPLPMLSSSCSRMPMASQTRSPSDTMRTLLHDVCTNHQASVPTLHIALLLCMSLIFSASQLRSLRSHVAQYSQVLEGLPNPRAVIACCAKLTGFCVLTDGEASEEFLA